MVFARSLPAEAGAATRNLSSRETVVAKLACGCMAETKKAIVKVKRQAGPKEPARWEEFSLNWRPSMNVIICLRDIAENPVTREGKKTTPITYDSNCLEEICGSCAMLIYSNAGMPCCALVDQLQH